MPAPSELPIEVRRACWDRLWQILLCDPQCDEEQEQSELGSEPADIDEGAANSTLRKEVSMTVA